MSKDEVKQVREVVEAIYRTESRQSQVEMPR